MRPQRPSGMQRQGSGNQVYLTPRGTGQLAPPGYAASSYRVAPAGAQAPVPVPAPPTMYPAVPTTTVRPPQRMTSGGKPRLSQFAAPAGTAVVYRSNDPSPVPTETASVAPIVLRPPGGVLQVTQGLPLDHTLQRPDTSRQEPPANKAPAARAPLQQPLLPNEDLEKAVVAKEAETEPVEAQEEESQLIAWTRPSLLFAAGVVVWIWPERIFAVLFFFAALLCTPHVGAVLRRGLALPRLGLWGSLATCVVDLVAGLGTALWERSDRWKPQLDKALEADSDFSKSMSKYILQVAGNVSSSLLQEKSRWLSPMVDAVGDVVPPALSKVMRKKDEWTPALVALIGDVVPPVLVSVLQHRAKQWTPALMEFVAEVTPKIVTIVLARPDLPPNIASFVDRSGPTLAPAVVRLIDLVIEDPQMMRTIRKITDSSMRDEEMINRIKGVIEQNLKDGQMYRAVGHGVMNAAEQSMDIMKAKAARAVGLR